MRSSGVSWRNSTVPVPAVNGVTKRAISVRSAAVKSSNAETTLGRSWTFALIRFPTPAPVPTTASMEAGKIQRQVGKGHARFYFPVVLKPETGRNPEVP